LLLGYLPNARRIDAEIITRKLALQALAGAQTIQKALLRQGDQFKHNLLVTQDNKAFWVDFDRAEVVDELDEGILIGFKKDIIEIHRMLFTYMVSAESRNTLAHMLIMYS
jgi:hypothetical protein